MDSSNTLRDISGETVLGFRVAAYRETHPEHGDKYGHKYSEHWSTPSQDPRVKVERLFTEAQLLAALQQPAAEPVAITWQDIRLAVGEGVLKPADVLAGANAELRRRAHLSNPIPEPATTDVEREEIARVIDPAAFFTYRQVAAANGMDVDKAPPNVVFPEGVDAPIGNREPDRIAAFAKADQIKALFASKGEGVSTSRHCVNGAEIAAFLIEQNDEPSFADLGTRMNYWRDKCITAGQRLDPKRWGTK